ncbi:hypothetical protein BD324DRAFT_682309 [Kockovaella imperatae]|uniref:Uncharacterized protein n=1 Tax=Kockovaella imperatae TaxID=4999 RepID=A0A1Y1UBV7_9TREE|nr:hypothetical protein BD324DRAFT_682309 [Kockovaella imperatae]ORX35528.1 hypothetical protein BD324DRAFT_682309 [Kockovaella imperatae]
MLSERDNSILVKIFDPEAQPESSARISANAVPLPGIPIDLFGELATRERRTLQPLNQDFPTPERIHQAIKELSSIIKSHPLYASAYVNRAQARRLQIQYDELFSPDAESMMVDIFADLDRAVDLAAPLRSLDQISAHQGNLLAAAHTHKGLLLLRAADITRGGAPAHGLPPALANMDADVLEEAASHELASGGRYGNTMAQQLAVKTNPYAKLCGSIVREAQRKEILETMRPHTFECVLVLPRCLADRVR